MSDQLILQNFMKVNNLSIQFYEQFKSSGPSSMLISMACLLNFVALLGIPMNSAIIFVTFKYRHIRKSTSSLLLAITAFFDILHQFGHFLFLHVALTGTNFIPYSLAFKYLCIPMFGCSARFWSIPLIALDRLVQMSFPKWHSFVNKFFYLAIPVSVNCLLAAFASFKFYQVSLQVPELPHTGFINDSNKLDLTNLISYYIIGGTASTIAIYSLIWIKIRLNMNSVSTQINSSVGYRLFKSLLIIVSANVGGYLLNIIFRRINIDHLLGLGPFQSWQFTASMGILLNLFIALDAPVLYIYSSDYRACFQTEFDRFLQ